VDECVLYDLGLYVSVHDVVPEEDGIGARPGACLNEAGRQRQRAREQGGAATHDNWGNHQVKLVNQPVRQQVAPQGAAAEDHDLFAALTQEAPFLGRRACQRPGSAASPFQVQRGTGRPAGITASAGA
jgi:hypothetical protein